MACQTISGKYDPPQPKADFPRAQSFYPREALAAAQEGSAQVSFCVDAAGILTEPPAIAASSGTALLDEAALRLAAAASGHYQPAMRGGRAVPGCAKFRIHFKLAIDPRFPTLSRRTLLINADFYRSSQALVSELDRASPRNVDPSDAAQLATTRHILSKARPVFARFLKLSATYGENIEQLAHASDVSAQERAAFTAYWDPRLEKLRRLETALEEAVAVLNEYADYLNNVQPARDETSGASTWTAEQRSALQAFRKRGMEAFRNFQQEAQAVCRDCEAGPGGDF